MASAHLTERQLQEAHRPLLIPEPPYEAGGDTILPVRNIGAGPAIRVFGCAQLRDLPPEVIGHFPYAQVPGVASGDTIELRFNGAGLPISKLISVEVTYDDVTDRHYTTDAHWERRQASFAHVRVIEGYGHVTPARAGRQAAAERREQAGNTAHNPPDRSGSSLDPVPPRDARGTPDTAP